jgi:hypothetical protein
MFPQRMLPYSAMAEYELYAVLILLGIIGAIFAVVMLVLWITDWVSTWRMKNKSPPVYKAPAKTPANRQSQIFVCTPLAQTVRDYFSFRECSMLSNTPPHDELLRWLRKAQDCKKPLLAAMIHNQLGVNLARMAEYSEAMIHFEAANDVFFQQDFGLTEGQAAAQCMQELADCGHPDAMAELKQAKEILEKSHYLFTHVASIFAQNLGACRIRKEAPQAVDLYLKAADALLAGDNVEAAWLFERAADFFEDKLHDQWYQWPIAAAKYDQVLSVIWQTGYTSEAKQIIAEAFRIARSHEEPFAGFLDRIKQSLS